MWLAVALSCAPAVAMGQNKPDAPMKLGRVRLYETGVGYFERNGRAQGGDEVALPVPAGHLDDALKTLVVLSKDGSTGVDGIEFSSSVSRHMGLALAGLSTVADGKIGYADLLDSLKGAPVEITAPGGRFTGRLVDVEPPPEGGHQACIRKPGDAEEVCTRSFHRTLLLLTQQNEIRRFASTEVSSVKATDPAFRSRMGAALDANSKSGTNSARRLRVLGTPGEEITLGYIAETPVWRSTYRLVLSESDADADVLQGWALLHNDTDEDWKQVNVELVNGRPDSFLFPLAAPRYARRELVTPERELHTVPQLLDQTVDNMWAPGEGIGLGSVGTIGHGSGHGVGIGYGAGHGRLGLSGVGESSLLAVGNLAALAKAEGTESGALFRYALAQPIDLRAHGSALLPFVSERVSVTPIAVVPRPGETARTGAHLQNTTQQTLPAGPIAVFAAGGFAGETALARTKPGESRILQFGFDLDVSLEESAHVSRDEPRVVLFDEGRLVEHFLRKRTVTLALINKSGRARKVYLPLSFVSNADVKGADALSYDEEKRQPMAIFESKSGGNDRRVLEVREGLTRTHEVDGEEGRERLRAFGRTTTLSPSQRAIFRKAVRLRDRAVALDAAVSRDQNDAFELNADLERVRKNLKVLVADSDGHDAMTEKMLTLENKLGKLRRRIVEREEERDRHRAQAARVLMELNRAAPRS